MNKHPSRSPICSAEVVVKFSAGHRLRLHDGKCRNVHGHNYVAHIRVTGPIRSDGMVVDFGELKAKAKGWIDEHWDHAMLYFSADEEMDRAMGALPGTKKQALHFEPTAECMADYLASRIIPKLMPGLTKVRVELNETDDCIAISEWEA